MASGTFRLTDAVIPESFAVTANERILWKNTMIQSGVITVLPALATVVQEGDVVTMRYFSHPDDDEPLAGSDDISTIAPSVKVEMTNQKTVPLVKNQVWSEAYLASQQAGVDPTSFVRSFVGDYWARQLQKTAIAQLRGVLKDNGANDSGDMINDVVGTSFTDGTTNFNKNAFINTIATFGDTLEDLTALFLHSTQYASALKADIISDQIPSQYPGAFGSYMRRPVYIDDSLPNGTSSVRASGAAGAANMYNALFLGAGAFGFAQGSPKGGSIVIDDAPRSGNASGAVYLISRQLWALHPRGTTITAAALTAAPASGPTNADTANNFGAAATWNRVDARKNVRIASLVTREA